MASEITAPSQVAGRTLYAHIKPENAGTRWNGSSFETYSAANWSTYVITMTEQGSSRVFVADFPSAITTANTYEFYVYMQMGGSPAEGDPIVSTGRVVWNGSEADSGSVTGAMTGSEFYNYCLRAGFKRTDKGTEFYEAVTDVTHDIRSRYSFEGAETEKTITDTISALGEYTLDNESDFGLITVVECVDDDVSWPLKIVTKDQWAQNWTNPAGTSTDYGVPKEIAIFANKLYIGPMPDKTSYIYRISYSIRGVTVTSDTSAVPFTDKFREVMKFGTFWRLYHGLKNDVEFQKNLQLYEAGIQRMISREMLNKATHSFTQQIEDIWHA